MGIEIEVFRIIFVVLPILNVESTPRTYITTS